MTRYENKSVTFGAPLPIEDVKAVGDAWEVSGYVSTYDLDIGMDRVARGAFTKSLASDHRVRFLYAHDSTQILGTAVSLKEDDRGLFGRFRISKTKLGEDIHTLLKDGALDSFSIGYLPDDYEIDKKTGIRSLTEVSLLECSLVSLPMNPQALVTSVKAADYAAMPLEDVLNDLRDRRMAAFAAIKAMGERRLSEQGRSLSDRVVKLLECLRQDAIEDADTLLALLTTPAPVPVEAKAGAATEGSTPPSQEPPVPAAAAGTSDTEADAHPAPVRTAGLVEAHLRRARLARIARKYSDVSLPPYDPVEHLARLETEGVLNEEPA